MNILFFDNAKSAHLIDFCDFIIETITLNRSKENSNFYFYLHSKVYSDLIALNKFNFEFLKNKCNIFIFPIPVEQNKCLFHNSFLESILNTFYEIVYLTKIVKSLKISKLIFLQIDIYQLSIGFIGFLFPNYLKISGILFTPYTLYPDSSFFLRFKKYFQTKILLLNNNISKIFILNDLNSVNHLKDSFKSSVFEFLPDPIGTINDYLSNTKIDIINTRLILKNQTHVTKFLILGNISPRKNLENIIQAFDYLSVEELSLIELYICGKFDSLDYFNKIQSIISTRIKKNIFITNVYHDQSYFNNILISIDVVFVAYKNFYASSGILGNAAKNSKLVIGTKNGVIGRVISDYSLGLTVDPNSSMEISSSIKKILVDKDYLISKARFKNYCTDNNFKVFSNKILST